MTDIAAAPVSLAGAERTRILFYCGVVIVVLNFVNISSGFHIIPISFVLKNKLHLSANGLATFALWAGIPAYFSFAFGMIRDFWSPFGRGDRGYVMLFGALSAACFALFAVLPVTLPLLLVCSLLTSMCFLFLWSAWNGLGSTIGQQFSMSGRISALWNFAGTITIFAALSCGGVLSGWLETMSAQMAVRILFLLVAAAMASIAAIGLWKPAVVYSHLHLQRTERHDFVADLKRLARHGPIYPALASWLLWNFSPGGSTVLQYYLSNTLHASDAQWGAYNAIFTISFVPTYVLFGYLSPRYPLSRLLWWGTLVAIPQMIPLLFVHSANAALVAAIPIGLMGGVATAAFMDLMIRACPKGLEGTLMMMAWSMFSLSGNFGNLLGTNLYEFHGGFFTCIAATTIVYALILPVLLLVPKKLIATPDGVAMAE